MKKFNIAPLWAFVFDYSVVFFLALLIQYFTKTEDQGFWESFWWTLLGLAVLHLVASFKTVHAQELGGILFFGAFVKEVKPGPTIVPVLSSSLVEETGLTVQIQIPGEPEEIDKTGSDIPKEGKVFPIRVTHAEGEDGDPLQKRLTTETTAVIRFRILRDSFREFFMNIGSQEEAKRQLRDTIESEIKALFAKETVAGTLDSLSNINHSLYLTATKLVEDNDWGVQIINVQIVDVGLSHQVNKSMSDVVSAQFQAKKIETLAKAEKKKRIEEGKGAAAARKLILLAEAKGYKNMAELLGIKEPELIIQVEAMKKALETSQHTIIPGGDAFGFAAGLSETIKKLGGKS